MWNRLVLFAALLVSVVHAADDGWGKVKSLPNGAEVRVTKVGARFGIVANVYDITDESIIVTTKTEQISIAKEQIVKIESHPFVSRSRVTRSSSTDPTPLDKDAGRAAPGPRRTPGPTGSATSSIHSGVRRQDWDLVWSRPKGS